MAALWIGFEEGYPSDLTLFDAEQYKLRRVQIVLVSQKIDGEAFQAAIRRLALDVFMGIGFPLQDLDPIKDDIVRVIDENPTIEVVFLKSRLLTPDE